MRVQQFRNILLSTASAANAPPIGIAGTTASAITTGSGGGGGGVSDLLSQSFNAGVSSAGAPNRWNAPYTAVRPTTSSYLSSTLPTRLSASAAPVTAAYSAGSPLRSSAAPAPPPVTAARLSYSYPPLPAITGFSSAAAGSSSVADGVMTTAAPAPAPVPSVITAAADASAAHESRLTAELKSYAPSSQHQLTSTNDAVISAAASIAAASEAVLSRIGDPTRYPHPFNSVRKSVPYQTSSGTGTAVITTGGGGSAGSASVGAGVVVGAASQLPYSSYPVTTLTSRSPVKVGIARGNRAAVAVGSVGSVGSDPLTSDAADNTAIVDADAAAAARVTSAIALTTSAGDSAPPATAGALTFDDDTAIAIPSTLSGTGTGTGSGAGGAVGTGVVDPAFWSSARAVVSRLRPVLTGSAFSKLLALLEQIHNATQQQRWSTASATSDGADSKHSAAANGTAHPPNRPPTPPNRVLQRQMWKEQARAALAGTATQIEPTALPTLLRLIDAATASPTAAAPLTPARDR